MLLAGLTLILGFLAASPITARPSPASPRFARGLHRQHETHTLDSVGVQALSAGWTYLGCIDRSTSRMSEGYAYHDSHGTTPEVCQTTCAKLGFRYAGVEDSHTCHCDNVVDDSTLRALEHSASDCAGNDRYQVYHKHQSSTTTPIKRATTSTPAPATYSTIGCWSDASVRTLNGSTLSSSSLTLASCANYCSNQGYKYAAAEYSTQCYCGNSYLTSRAIAATRCGYSCAGDRQSICGGSWTLTLLALNGEPALVAAPSSTAKSASTSATSSKSTILSTSNVSSKPVTSTSSAAVSVKPSSLPSSSTTVTASKSSSLSPASNANIALSSTIKPSTSTTSSTAVTTSKSSSLNPAGNANIALSSTIQPSASTDSSTAVTTSRASSLSPASNANIASSSTVKPSTSTTSSASRFSTSSTSVVTTTSMISLTSTKPNTTATSASQTSNIASSSTIKPSTSSTSSASRLSTSSTSVVTPTSMISSTSIKPNTTATSASQTSNIASSSTIKSSTSTTSSASRLSSSSTFVVTTTSMISSTSVKPNTTATSTSQTVASINATTTLTTAHSLNATTSATASVTYPPGCNAACTSVIGVAAAPKATGTKSLFAHHMIGNTYSYTPAVWSDDISLAKSAGIDGFALNYGSDEWQPARVDDAYSVASSAGFKLFLSLDVTSLSCSSASDAATHAATIVRHANSSAQYIYQNRTLVSTFSGEYCNFGQTSTLDGWNYLRQLVLSQGYAIYLIPAVFSDIRTFNTPSMAWMDGEFNWNSGWPMGSTDLDGSSDVSYQSALAGKTYMPAISPAFFTYYGPNSWNKDWIYRGDNWLLASRMEQVVQMRDQVDFAEIISWNDYGESHYIGPVRVDQPNSQGWTNGMPHTAWLSVVSYYAAAFKTGAYPASTDNIWLWSRPHPRDANPSVATAPRPTGATYTDDNMYAFVTLSSPATVTITSGVNNGTWTLPAGVNKISLASAPGAIGGLIKRGSTVVKAFDSTGAFNYTNTPVDFNYNYYVAQA